MTLGVFRVISQLDKRHRPNKLQLVLMDDPNIFFLWDFSWSKSSQSNMCEQIQMTGTLVGIFI